MHRSGREMRKQSLSITFRDIYYRINLLIFEIQRQAGMHFLFRNP